MRTKPVDPDTIREGDCVLFERDDKFPARYEMRWGFAHISRVENVTFARGFPGHILCSRGSTFTGDFPLEISAQSRGWFRKRNCVRNVMEEIFSVNREEQYIGFYSHGRPPSSAYYLRGEKHDLRPRLAWRLSAADAAQISQLRPKFIDPLAGTSWKPASMALYVALSSMQYERWGLDEIDLGSGLMGISSRRPPEIKAELMKRYAGITPENYGGALDALIQRFGQTEFAAAVIELFRSHLLCLHGPWHLSPFKLHSDMNPLGPVHISIAEDVIHGLHPLPKDMTESGHWVNVKTLFGDRDFWFHMRNQYPLLFDQFVDFIKSLPKDYDLRHPFYSPTHVVNPIALIRQYFPEAFQVIHERRPDFDLATSPTRRSDYSLYALPTELAPFHDPSRLEPSLFFKGKKP